LIVSVNAAPPANAEFGDKLVRVNGALIVNGSVGGESAPGSVTPTAAVPPVASRLAGTVAESTFGVEEVVLRGVPFQVTTVDDVKPDPFTAIVNDGEPALALFGLRLVNTRGARVIVNVSDLATGCG
jgi:hypothetical protein